MIGEELFSADLKDFTALIAKVRGAKPDIVYISSFDNPSVPLVQQLRQLKVRALDVHHTMLTGALSKQVGKDLEGMTGELTWYPSVKGPYADLFDRVMQRTGITMFDSIWTLARLDSYIVMIQAIEKAGAVDREKVAEGALQGHLQVAGRRHRVRRAWLPGHRRLHHPDAEQQGRGGVAAERRHRQAEVAVADLAIGSAPPPALPASNAPVSVPVSANEAAQSWRSHAH